MPAGLQAWSGPNRSDALPCAASGTDAHPPPAKPSDLPPPAAAANLIAGSRSHPHPEAPGSGNGSPLPLRMASGAAAAPEATPHNLCLNRCGRPLAPVAEAADRPIGSGAGTAPDPHDDPGDALQARNGLLPASGAAAAQLLRLPLDSVRFLQAMAEHGEEARPVRIGANPPEGHVLFRSLSD